MSPLLAMLLASVATIGVAAAEPAQAKLLVGIMVDGLDQEYLRLLRDRFSSGGFKRIIDNSAAMTIDYGTTLDPTASATVLMTGAAPSVSGVGSQWRYDRDAMRSTHVFADRNALGNFSSTAYSPAALRLTTITDEARIAADGTSVAYAIAADPGVAIALGGHSANSTLWLDTKTGNWASSTAYGDMPATIATRNRTTPLQVRIDTMSWTPTLKPSDYPALPDHLKRYPFRYVFPRTNSRWLDNFIESPLLNREITGVARDLIANQRLGTHDGVTDVLNIAFSLQPISFGKSTDKRVELMDAYIKLDRNLEALFNDIDRRLGANNAVIVLAGTPPQNRRRRDDDRWGIPYGEFSTRKAVSLLNVYLMAVYGNGDFVSSCHDRNIYLNHKLITDRKLSLGDVRKEAATFLARMTGIDRVYTLDDILAARAGDNPEAMRRNTVAATAGDLLLEVAPGYEIVDDFNGSRSKDTTPMVECAATTTAPLYISAPDLAPQTFNQAIDARAVAPAVTRILRIRSPNGAKTAPPTL